MTTGERATISARDGRPEGQLTHGRGILWTRGVAFLARTTAMRLIPRRVQKQARRLTSALAMPIAVRWVGRQSTRGSVSLLRYAWNNDSFSADVDYLMAVAREAEKARGPILECGSGITTLLLGVIAQRRGIEVCTFEHDAKWWAAAKGVLDR